MRLVRLIWLSVLFCAGALTTASEAHERSESTSHWTFDNGDLHGIVTARTREVTRLTIPGDNYDSLAQIFAAHVQHGTAVSVDGKPCAMAQAPALLESEPGYLRVDVKLRCATGDVLNLKLETFFVVAPSHHHFLYLESADAGTAKGAGARREAILTASAPSIQFDLRPSAADNASFIQFIGMGIEHIATGIDHLAFLLALLIGARTMRQVLAIVTGFTLGHSLTLSLAALGVVQADRSAVECLIGLTIALAAAQNLIRGERQGRIASLVTIAITSSILLVPADLRPGIPAALIASIALAAGAGVWLASTRDTAFSIPARFTMAMGFGLVHGLGFASALQDLQLPRSLLATTLLGFNVGVEVGQLLVVTAAILLVRLAAAIAPDLRRSAESSAIVASAALLAAGLAWFLTRAVG